VAVPAGDTLDLSKLKSGTTVTFTGTTTFGYKEWEGPLVKFGGTNVHAQGSGVLDGNGAQYWDGQGSNGGKSALCPACMRLRPC
jgi:polygalacturonase